MGATVNDQGINFALFSRNATAVYLELFEGDEPAPWRSLRLHPRRNRTGDVWHLFVHGAGHGQLYGWRVDGPYDPRGQGHRFNVNKLLMDPYAREVVGSYDMDRPEVYGYDPASPDDDLSFSGLDSAPHAARSVALAQGGFDWGDSRRPNTPLERSVIYELHVHAFTAHASSGAAYPGTYRGLTEKIPYLKELGVTAVELLPVHAFNGGEFTGTDPVTGAPLHNYWGYNTLAFFAPERRYALDQRPGGAVDEFKGMVRALHEAGIELILDVVFNHTIEGDAHGPTTGFRGLDNTVYYMLDGGRRYRNYSGVGNTVNCNIPVVKQLILDCLRYWVVEMQVDGFRFDLATILGRDGQGAWIDDLGLLYDIGGDPVLRGCKLIAEAWDAEGMYKVGGFPRGWAEWNGRFRDDLRRFVRGDPGMVPQLARRLGGSPDLFSGKESPVGSVNFVTAHDGFTLRDLVSYREKHNLRNGEQNRDGADQNFSCGWGKEGETDDPAIRRLRLRQAKNMLVALLLSRGTPMLLGGDERWHTKQGNNNTYCQDNLLSWFNWDPDDEAEEMTRFTRGLIQLRRGHPALRRPRFVTPFSSAGEQDLQPDITWHGVEPGAPDWSHCSRTLALQIHGASPGPGDDLDRDFYAVFSAWSDPLSFRLPRPPSGGTWHRLVDTALGPPDDVVAECFSPEIPTEHYRVTPGSAVLLASGLPPRRK